MDRRSILPMSPFTGAADDRFFVSARIHTEMKYIFNEVKTIYRTC